MDVTEAAHTAPMDGYNTLICFVPDRPPATNGQDSPSFPLYQSRSEGINEKGLKSMSTPSFATTSLKSSLRIQQPHLRIRIVPAASTITCEFSPCHMDLDFGTVDRLEPYFKLLGSSDMKTESRAATIPRVEPSATKFVFILPYIRLAISCPDMTAYNDYVGFQKARHENHLRHESIVVELEEVCIKSQPNTTSLESIFSAEFVQLRLHIQDPSGMVLSRLFQVYHIADRNMTTLLSIMEYAETMDDPVVKPKLRAVLQSLKPEQISLTDSTVPTIALLHENPDSKKELSVLYRFLQRISKESSAALEVVLPLVDFHCTKKDFDRFQLLFNDIALWEPWWIFEKRHENSLLKSRSEHTMDHSDDDDSIADDRAPDEFIPSIPDATESNQARHSLLSGVTLACTNVKVNKIVVKVAQDDSEYQLAVKNASVFVGIQLLGIEYKNLIFFECEECALTDLHTNPSYDILSRTIPASIPFLSASPEKRSKMITLTVLFSYDPELNVKAVDVSALLANITWHYQTQSKWLSHLINFIDEPNEMVSPDYTNRYTKLFLEIAETTIDYKPLKMSCRSVLPVELCRISTTIIPATATTGIVVTLQKAHLMMVDSSLSLAPFDPNFALTNDRESAYAYWLSLKFVPLVIFDDLVFNIRTDERKGTSKRMDIEIGCRLMIITACSDSFATLCRWIGYVAGGKDSKESRSTTESPEIVRIPSMDAVSEADSDYQDALLDVDEEAFRYEPPVGSAGLTDDFVHALETNLQLEFRESHYAPESPKSATRLSDEHGDWEKISKRPPASVRVDTSTVTGIVSPSFEIIRVLQDRLQLNIVDDHFAAPTEEEEDSMSAEDK